MIICPMMTIRKEQKQLMRITEETDILLDREECPKGTEQLLQQTKRKLTLFLYSYFCITCKEIRTQRTNVLCYVYVVKKKGNDVMFYGYDHYYVCKIQAPRNHKWELRHEADNKMASYLSLPCNIR